MEINKLTLELQELIKEMSREFNNGEVSYAYMSGYFIGVIKQMAITLNPKKFLEEEIEHLKRSE
jgi:hypothetical protein